MHLVLQREPSKGEATLGELSEGTDPICDILEDPIREVKGQPVASWKIAGITAIPAGTYRITMENSPRFGPDTLTVNGVEGYVGVRIHGGNKAVDTEGCLLPGMRNSSNTVASSQVSLRKLKQLVRNAIMREETVWLEIRNPLTLV